ncbi:MAG: hypothetical protein II819_10720 [Fibrobacter sp.]|nr:hypothetical protein [Fibrobacter sp.]
MSDDWLEDIYPFQATSVLFKVPKRKLAQLIWFNLGCGIWVHIDQGFFTSKYIVMTIELGAIGGLFSEFDPDGFRGELGDWLLSKTDGDYSRALKFLDSKRIKPEDRDAWEKTFGWFWKRAGWFDDHVIAKRRTRRINSLFDSWDEIQFKSRMEKEGKDYAATA